MPRVLARCRGRELTSRRAAHAMLVAAGALTCWVVYLALTLTPSQHRSHWVVLDVVEVSVLLVIARSLRHDRRWIVVFASLFAVPVFWYDAAIDITSSHRDAVELVIASMMALLIEVPAGAGVLFLAVRCAFHHGHHSRGGEQPDPDRGAIQTVQGCLVSRWQTARPRDAHPISIRAHTTGPHSPRGRLRDAAECLLGSCGDDRLG